MWSADLLWRARMRSFLVSSADLAVRAQGCGASLGRKGSRQADSDAMFQILWLFYLCFVKLMGVTQPRFAVTSRAEKNGSNMSPSVRLKPGASVFVSVPALLESC